LDLAGVRLAHDEHVSSRRSEMILDSMTLPQAIGDPSAEFSVPSSKLRLPGRLATAQGRQAVGRALRVCGLVVV
jgi:hypothetical protein